MLIVAFLAFVSSTRGESQGVYITDTWNGGFHGHFTLSPSQAVDGWTAHLKFSGAVDKLEVRLCGVFFFKSSDVCREVVISVHEKLKTQ